MRRYPWLDRGIDRVYTRLIHRASDSDRASTGLRMNTRSISRMPAEFVEVLGRAGKHRQQALHVIETLELPGKGSEVSIFIRL
jgi:hypothetical protein